MLKRKTHFEQVPVEVVKKTVVKEELEEIKQADQPMQSPRKLKELKTAISSALGARCRTLQRDTLVDA